MKRIDQHQDEEVTPVGQRVIAAAAEYQELVDLGLKPVRNEFLAMRREIAKELTPYLEAIDFVSSAIPPRELNNSPNGTTILGDFRIVRRLGQGGMGMVFEAEQLSLHRRVALKILPHLAGLDERARQRFAHESQAAAALKHPHIVPIFAVGEEGGVHFYAMQLVVGETLVEVLRYFREAASPLSQGHASTGNANKDATLADLPQSNLDPGTQSSALAGLASQSNLPAVDRFRWAAKQMLDAANALQHAHEVGVIHRDIKPGNLLLDQDGKIWVTDFGLAKLPGSDLTGSEDVLGTLRYMAPEQASGRAVSLDARSDVYSLGATLYEMLTLEQVFKGAAHRELLLRCVLMQEPIMPRKIDQRIPVDLETITLKALAKEPTDRYESAGALAQDLQRFLDEMPITARPPKVTQVAWKWMRRNRSLAITIGAAIPLLLLAVIAGLAIGAYRIDEQRRKAESALERESNALAKEKVANERAEERLVAERRARVSEQLMSYNHSVSLANVEAENGNIEAAQSLLASCPQPLRGFEWNYVYQTCQPELSSIPIDIDYVHEIAFTLSGELATISPQGTRLWNTPRGQLTKQLPQLAVEVANNSIKMTPDGKYVIRFLRRTFRNNQFPPNMLLVHIFDASTGKLTGAFPGHSEPLFDLVCSPDSKSIVTCDRAGKLAIWDIELKQPTIFLSDAQALAVAYSPKGDRLAVATKRAIEFRDAATGKVTKKINDLGQDNRAGAEVAFSPDGQFVATTNLGGKVKVIDVETGESPAVVEAEMGDDGIFVFSPDGRSLATTDHRDYSIRVWNWRTGELERRFFVGRERVRNILFSPDGDYLVTLQGKSSVRLWSVTSDLTRIPFGQVGRMVATSGNSQMSHGRALFNPNGNKVVAFAGTSASVFSFPQGVFEHAFDSKTQIIDMQFDATQSLLRQLSTDGERSLNLENGQIQEQSSSITLLFSASYGTFADDRNVNSGLATICPQVARFCGEQLLKAAPPKKDSVAWIDAIVQNGPQSLRQYRASHGALVYCVAGTKDGKRRAAAATSENALRAWNDNLNQEAWMEESRVRVLALEYSDDGKLLGVADANGLLRILDADTGRLISKIALPIQERVQFDFDSKGERIAIAVGRLFEGAGEVRICEVAKGQSLVSIPFDRSIESVQFSPDDQYLLAADYSGKLWSIRQDPLSSEERLSAHDDATSKWRTARIAKLQAERDHLAAIFHIDRQLVREPNSNKLKGQRVISNATLGLPVTLDESTAEHLAKTVNLYSLPAAYCLSAYYYQHSNQPAHQQLVDQLIKRIRPETDDMTFSLVYRLGVLGPGGVKNLEALVGVCEKRYPSADKDAQFALAYLRGMARYRAGQFEAALDDLQKTTKELSTPSPSFPIIHIYLAMTFAQLNQREEALKSLATATELFERGIPTRKKFRNSYYVDYHFPLLKQEFEKLLEEKSP